MSHNKNHIETTLSHRDKEPEKGVLYLVGTPIGNLSDISPRALNILKNSSLIACEDTRQTKKIMNKYGFKNNLTSFSKLNFRKKIPIIISKLSENKSIALVSDAGLPTICDPGEELVKIAKLHGYEVVCIPGPCAALVALVSSGFSASQFIFEGFLPKKKLDREKMLYQISKNEKTTILFEAPHRLKQLLNELKLYCGGDREVQICRELTKKFEEHIGPNINTAIEYFETQKILGEFTIVIKGNKNKNDINLLVLKKDLKDLINAGLSLSSASKYLAKKHNLTKSYIYDINK